MTTPASPKINTTASATLTVTTSDLASALSVTPPDPTIPSFPAVFATSRMVARMEIAAAKILVSALGPGQMSVGVSVDVTHGAPTLVGGNVVAEARYLGTTGTKGKDGLGKLFDFEVSAKDEGGEIGRGKHVRAIVDASRLEGAAVKRMGIKGGL